MSRITPGLNVEDGNESKEVHVSVEKDAITNEIWDDEYDDLMAGIDENLISNHPTMVTSADKKAESSSSTEFPSHDHHPSDNIASQFQVIPSQQSRAMKAAKRSFPGPAGIIPSQTADQQGNPIKRSLRTTLLFDKVQSSEVVPPQRIKSLVKSAKNALNRPYSDKPISNKPWKSIITALNLNPNDNSSILNSMNIKWIQENKKKFQVGAKIPFMVLVVKEAPEDMPSVSFTKRRILFMDQTGTIAGHFDDLFSFDFGNLIVPGTCFALQNCKTLLLKKTIVITPSVDNVVCVATTPPPSTGPSQSGANPPVGYKKDSLGSLVSQRAPFQIEKLTEEYAKLLNEMEMSTKKKDEQSEIVELDRGENANFYDDEDEDFLNELALIDF